MRHARNANLASLAFAAAQTVLTFFFSPPPPPPPPPPPLFSSHLTDVGANRGGYHDQTLATDNNHTSGIRCNATGSERGGSTSAQCICASNRCHSSLQLDWHLSWRERWIRVWKARPAQFVLGDFNSFEYSANGWLFGGTFGAQIQSGHVVIGVEGDLDWTNFKGSGTGPVNKLGGGVTGTATLSSKVSAISTLRTRIGYAENNWLFYATVGLAVTKATSEYTQTVGFVCGGTTVPCTSKSDLHPGVAAGAGVEYGITQNVSAKLEYLWLGAGATNTLKENMVRAGLNYRFGGIEVNSELASNRWGDRLSRLTSA